MNSGYDILNFIIELKNDYEVKKVLIETKMKELEHELEELHQKKYRMEKQNLEPSSIFSPYCNNSNEMNQITQFIETKENELAKVQDSKLENHKKQIQLQNLQKILSDMIDQECEMSESKREIEVHKNNQILTALNFHKSMNHSIALQLKSISGDLESLLGVVQNAKPKKKSAHLLKRDIQLLGDMADYLHAEKTDTEGIVKAVNDLIQQKTNGSSVHIVFTYDEQVEQADTTKKYFVKQLIEYLYGIFETIKYLSDIEIHLTYEVGQYHLIIKIDSYSSDAVESYPYIDQLVQVYDGIFSIESNEYFTQFHIVV